MEHPQKILADAIAMYSSRVVIAIEKRKSEFVNGGMFVMMPPGGTCIKPDMKVLCLEQQQVLKRVDPSHSTVPGALAMFANTDADDRKAVFGVIFADGGILATVLQVHNADRDRDA